MPHATASIKDGRNRAAGMMACTRAHTAGPRNSPAPYRTVTTPLRLEGPRSAEGARRVAILCSDGFADPDWELHELATGHWAMLTAPGPLAALLHAIAAG